MTNWRVMTTDCVVMGCIAWLLFQFSSSEFGTDFSELPYSSQLQPSLPTKQGASPGRFRRALRKGQLKFDDSAGNGTLETLIGSVHRFTKLKRWHYSSVATERHFFGFAVASLNYVGTVFCYIVDRTAKIPVRHEYSGVWPLSPGIEISPSSVEGCTRSNGFSPVSVCYNDDIPGWSITIDVPMTSSTDGSIRQFKATFSISETAESLAVLLPLPGEQGRVGYTHKVAGSRASGGMQLGHLFDYTFLDAMATVDWTKQLARRTTVWKWVSVSTRAKVRTVEGVATEKDVGINLSTDVMDDDQGVSAENAVWVDGKVTVLGNVEIETPAVAAERTSSNWQLRAGGGRCDNPCEPGTSCECFDVKFEPRGAREEHINAWLIQSDFVQPYGVFTGHVRLADGTRIQLENAFGVCEDHMSVW